MNHFKGLIRCVAMVVLDIYMHAQVLKSMPHDYIEKWPLSMWLYLGLLVCIIIMFGEGLCLVRLIIEVAVDFHSNYCKFLCSMPFYSDLIRPHLWITHSNTHVEVAVTDILPVLGRGSHE